MDVDKLPFDTNLSELQIAVNAALDAGNKILQVYSKDFSFDVKSDDSPITEADVKSNKTIKAILSKTNFDILSEEDKDDQGRLLEETIWIVDPLDGTSDFIDKTGEFTVMIALIKNKKPILGVISWPTEDTLFVAQKDSGAFRYSDGEWSKIRVTEITKLENCRIVGSRHHLSDKEKLFIKNLAIRINKLTQLLAVNHLSPVSLETDITRIIY